MTQWGTDFTFMVMENTAPGLVRALNEALTALRDEGWALVPGTPIETTTPATRPQPPAPRQQQPVPTAGQQGQKSSDAIDGYVLGTYTDRKTMQVAPCVWLYTARRPFKAYTIYPEDFALLPFGVPVMSSVGHAQFVSGSAPSREQAITRGQYHQHPFLLPVIAATNPDGTPVTNKNGYIEYRPRKASELADQPAPPPSARASQATQHQTDAAPFQGVPDVNVKMDPPPADALGWTMQDPEDAVGAMNLPEDVVQWFNAYRSQEVAYMPMGGKKTGDVQWALLNEWCARQVGAQPGDTLGVPGMGELPLAGLLIGTVCDRYAEKPAEAPQEVVVDILRRCSPKRGNEENLSFDPVFAGALSRAFQSEYVRVRDTGTLAF
jgi:hypothetical protein